MFFYFFETIEKIFAKTKPLKGVTFWISGAVPEYENWSNPLVDRDILEFVSVFSSLTYKLGGNIVHGSHPSLTPALKRSASRFSKNSNQLQLFISDMFIENNSERPTGRFKETIVNAIKNEEGKYLRNESLTFLREKMSKEANFAIFIGGKFHNGTGFKPGVAEEIEIAIINNIPSFILAGVQGKAKDLANPFILKKINPFASEEEIQEISYEKNVSILPSKILSSVINNKTEIINRKTSTRGSKGSN